MTKNKTDFSIFEEYDKELPLPTFIIPELGERFIFQQNRSGNFTVFLLGGFITCDYVIYRNGRIDLCNHNSNTVIARFKDDMFEEAENEDSKNTVYKFVKFLEKDWRNVPSTLVKEFINEKIYGLEEGED